MRQFGLGLNTINAISVSGSDPITSARRLRPSESFTAIRSAPSMTWWFVRMCPSSSMMKPVPAPRRGSSPRRRLSKGSAGTSGRQRPSVGRCGLPAGTSRSAGGIDVDHGGIETGGDVGEIDDPSQAWHGGPIVARQARRRYSRGRRGRTGRQRARDHHAHHERYARGEPDGETREPSGHFSHIISFSSLSWVPPGPNRCDSVCVFGMSRGPATGSSQNVLSCLLALVLETIARMEHLMFKLLLSVVVAGLLAHAAPAQAPNVVTRDQRSPPPSIASSARPVS